MQAQLFVSGQYDPDGFTRARNASCLALIQELVAVIAAFVTHGEHAESDEVVAEDDGGEEDEHYEDRVEGFAGYGIGDREGEVCLGCQL